jgi:hypothetical protein
MRANAKSDEILLFYQRVHRCNRGDDSCSAFLTQFCSDLKRIGDKHKFQCLQSIVESVVHIWFDTFVEIAYRNVII